MKQGKEILKSLSKIVSIFKHYLWNFHLISFSLWTNTFLNCLVNNSSYYYYFNNFPNIDLNR